MLRSSGNRTRYLLSLASCLALANAPLLARAQEEAVEAPGLPTIDDFEFFDESRQPGAQKVPHASVEDERRAALPLFNQVLKSWPLSVWTAQATEDQCPLCGQTHQQDELPGLFSLALKSQGRTSSRLLGRSAGEAGKPSQHERNRLRPGETANILVQVRERLGSNALSGTSFDDRAPGVDSEADEGDFEPSSQTFVEWIQALEEEHAAEGRSHRPGGTCPAASSLCAAAASQPTGEALELDADRAALRIEILRKSSRELSRTAELLEEADLFDQADEIYRIAGELRNQARAVVLAGRRDEKGGWGEGGMGGDEDGRAAAAF
ncbi:MAG: hypothetical protein WD847_02940 [Pirellulales bacterium]